jgi:hypothetical protein
MKMVHPRRKSVALLCPDAVHLADDGSGFGRWLNIRGVLPLHRGIFQLSVLGDLSFTTRVRSYAPALQLPNLSARSRSCNSEAQPSRTTLLLLRHSQILTVRAVVEP